MKEHEMFQPTSRTSEKWGGLGALQKKNRGLVRDILP